MQVQRTRSPLPHALHSPTPRTPPRSASHRPSVLAHRPVEVDRTHDSRLVAALYNATFSGVGGRVLGPGCSWGNAS